MKKLLFVFTAIGIVHPAAMAQTGVFLPCDISKTETLHWAAAGLDLTIEAKVENEAGISPASNIQIYSSENKPLLTVQGRGFIDGAPFYEDDYNCDYHFHMARNSLVSSMRENEVEIFGLKLKTVNDIKTNKDVSENCRSSEHDTILYESKEYDCADYEWFGKIFEYGQQLPDQFEKLMSQNAPIISVSQSYHNSVIYAWDAETETFVHVLGIGSC